MNGVFAEALAKERLSRYFADVEDVDFVYLFSPLAGTGEKELTDFDVAIAYQPFLTLPQLFEAQIDVYNALRKVLATDRIAVVVINECPIEYQRLIYRTGTAVCVRNRVAHEKFCARCRKRRRLLPC
jgi:hypothetical protein